MTLQHTAADHSGGWNSETMIHGQVIHNHLTHLELRNSSQPPEGARWDDKKRLSSLGLLFLPANEILLQSATVAELSVCVLMGLSGSLRTYGWVSLKWIPSMEVSRSFVEDSHDALRWKLGLVLCSGSVQVVGMDCVNDYVNCRAPFREKSSVVFCWFNSNYRTSGKLFPCRWRASKSSKPLRVGNCIQIV